MVITHSYNNKLPTHYYLLIYDLINITNSSSFTHEYFA